jgi:hypothetical protein
MDCQAVYLICYGNVAYFLRRSLREQRPATTRRRGSWSSCVRSPVSPVPTMDGAAFIDANATCQAVEDELPSVDNEEVREALAGMVASLKEFRDNRVKYNIAEI